MATAGQRDKLVRIEQRSAVDTPSASGNPVPTWMKLADVYMRRVDSLGRESLGVNQVTAEFNTEWFMPYLSTMDPELLDVPKLRRLVHRGRTHDIKSAVLRPRPEGQQIHLTTVAGTGR